MEQQISIRRKRTSRCQKNNKRKFKSQIWLGTRKVKEEGATEAVTGPARVTSTKIVAIKWKEQASCRVESGQEWHSDEDRMMEIRRQAVRSPLRRVKTHL
jgi:hypothetical protein